MAVNDPKVIKWAVEAPRTIAVVGLSDKPDRPSYHVSEEMQQRGHKIVPVTPKRADTILGEKVYRSLAEIPFPVDVVDVFRRSETIMEVVQEIEQMQTKPKVLWLQQGIVNDEAMAAAEAMGIDGVQDHCIYVEATRHGR
ncbi:MAG: CoA-binding protein [Bacillota bacterium]